MEDLEEKKKRGSKGTENRPYAQLDKITRTEDARSIVASVRDLQEFGKPASIEELKDRIDMFFDFCNERNLRPSIELFSAFLGVSRVTLDKWAKGINCSEEWADIVSQTKQLLRAYVEQLFICQKINPASGIFILKNVAGWKDTLSIENESEPKKQSIYADQTPEEIQKKLDEDIPLD